MGSGFGSGEQKRLEFCRRMRQIPGVDLKAEVYPGIPLPLLADEGNRRAVLSAMDWVLEQTRRPLPGE